MAETKNTIPQFSGSAYQSWAFKLVYGLQEKKLVSFVCEFKGRPRKACPALITPLSDPELNAIVLADRGVAIRQKAIEIAACQLTIDEWMESDLDAQAFIVKYLGASEQIHVRNCDFAYQMWDSLKSYYMLQGEIEVSNAEAQLSAIMQSESEDISAYVRRLQELHGVLDSLGQPIPATKQATNLINSLNSRYRPMVRTIQTWALSAPNLYNVQQILSTLQQDDVREEITAQKGGEPLSAPRIAAHYGGSGPSGRARPGSGGDGKETRECHKCHKVGHIAINCHQKRSFDHAKCTKCGKMGHYASYCKEGNSNARNANGRDVVCTYCGCNGHDISVCRAKIGGDRVRASMAAKEHCIDPSKFTAGYTIMTDLSALSASDHSSSLILDSGASEHFIPDRASFESYSTELPLSQSFIYTADHRPHEVKGHGVVCLRLRQSGKTSVVRIKALHVPTIRQHLISMTCLTKRGGVDFHLSHKSGPSLILDGVTWCDVQKTENGLLLLSATVLHPGHDVAVLSGKVFSACMDWHLRLGHPGLSTMQHMSSKGLIPPLLATEYDVIKSCEVCVSAKLSQSPHQSESVSTKECKLKLDRVHMDIVGPIAVLSNHGRFKYFQSSIDVATRYSVVSLLKSKSDAFTAAKQSLNMLESESGCRLKSLRTDGGGEYTSHEWKAYSQMPGHEFFHQTTAPYSPEQNGLCERLNRTLIEKMRCMLIWSLLPASYWDVAVLHANWVRNRSPTNGLNGDMPYEAWSGRKHEITTMHTFGCLVQYLKVGHDKNKKSEKFASKTSYGVFLGMAIGQAGYLIFDPTRAGVLVRTDVKFHDSVPGYPRLVGRNKSVNHPHDSDFFCLFPCDEETEKPAGGPTPSHVPATQPPIPLNPPPVDIIQLSSNTESGEHMVTDDDDAYGDDVVDGGGDESIADRVAARHRAMYGGIVDLY